MEVCGTGQGELWIGYRQQHDFSIKDAPYDRYHSVQTIKRARWYYLRRKRVGPRHEFVESVEVATSVGGDILPYVRQIERIIHQAQKTNLFTMAVNVCEDCCVTFAEWVPQDGQPGFSEGTYMPYPESFDARQEQLHHLQTYGKHTCSQCEKSVFLCADCVGFHYQYCFDYCCRACVCVDCDGDRSIQGGKVMCDLGYSTVCMCGPVP